MRGELKKEVRLQISITRLKKGIEKLREVIVALQKSDKEKDKRIKELEQKLLDKESERKELLSYLYKPKKEKGESKPLGKKKGALAYHRPIPPLDAITQESTYTIKQCPICKNSVGDIVDTVVKYTEDIDLTPRPLITKHTITRHWCKQCETYVKSPDIPPLQRIGINTLGYILYARYRLRLPIEKIQESLLDLYNFKISQGEISEKLQYAQDLFGKEYEAITVLIQEAKAVYADETGWRMNGQNWWLWVFVTAQGTQYVIEDTRGKGIPEKILGEKTDRVIISDGYAAYQNLPGDKQQCWVHLLRKAKLHSLKLYEDLVMLYKKLILELEKPLGQRDKETFLQQFTKLIEKEYTEPSVEKVKYRMKHHASVLFTCLEYEGILGSYAI